MTTDRVARVGALLLLLTTACTSPSPSSGPADSQAPPSTSGPSDGAAAEPGQPYDAGEILDAMRTSPRPDGVPDEVETDAIAGAIAEAIWTIDGATWDDIVIGGSCAADACLVEVSGSRAGSSGDDLWAFAVVPSSGAVTVESTELSAIDDETVDDLDALARSLLEPADLEGMRLTAATWQPPPDADRFALSYRSGGEEGSCGLELVVDIEASEIVDERSIGGC